MDLQDDTNTHAHTYLQRFYLFFLYDSCHFIQAKYAYIVMAIFSGNKKIKEEKSEWYNGLSACLTNHKHAHCFLHFLRYTREMQEFSVTNFRSVHNISQSRTHAHTHVQFATATISCRAKRRFTTKADRVTGWCVNVCL